jgi:hypothetical protein
MPTGHHARRQGLNDEKVEIVKTTVSGGRKCQFLCNIFRFTPQNKMMQVLKEFKSLPTTFGQNIK